MRAKSVYESMTSQRGVDPKSAMGIGIESAIERVKDEIGWRESSFAGKNYGIYFDDNKALNIYNQGGINKIAVERILKDLAEPPKVKRKSLQASYGGLHILNDMGVLWDPEYMWPTPSLAPILLHKYPDKLRKFANKHWTANQIYSAGVSSRDSQFLKIGIQRGADNLGIGGVEPFITAAEEGDSHLVRLLLQKSPTDPSGSSSDEKRYQSSADWEASSAPIRTAAKLGHYDIVKMLMDDGRSDPSAVNNFALKWSFKNGHLHVAKLLLTEDRVRAKFDLLPETVKKAIKNSSLLESISFQRGADPKSSMRLGGFHKIYKEIEADGVDPKYIDMEMALLWSAERGNYDYVKYLLDAGVDPNANNGDALKEASYYGHDNIARLLLSRGAEVSHSNHLALRYAVGQGNIEIAKMLLNAGADPFSIDGIDFTRLDDERKKLLIKYMEKHDRENRE